MLENGSNVIHNGYVWDAQSGITLYIFGDMGGV